MSALIGFSKRRCNGLSTVCAGGYRKRWTRRIGCTALAVLVCLSAFLWLTSGAVPHLEREAGLRLVGRGREKERVKERVTEGGLGRERGEERGVERAGGRGRGWGRVLQVVVVMGMVMAGVSLGCCTAQWALPLTGAVCLLGTCRWSGCSMLGAGWLWRCSSTCTGSEPHTLQAKTVKHFFSQAFEGHSARTLSNLGIYALHSVLHSVHGRHHPRPQH